MGNLFIEVVRSNVTKGYRITDPDFQETKYSDNGVLYKALVKEYGRCISKQYIEMGKIIGYNNRVQIGWVFAKRETYTDAKKPIKKDRDTFICETWVSVHSKKPDIVTTPHFAKF